jgi:hypothetical protein
MQDFSFKKRTLDSLEKLENAAREFKNKVKVSNIYDKWFKKIDADNYEKIAKSIELWIDILEHAELIEKQRNTK